MKTQNLFFKESIYLKLSNCYQTSGSGSQFNQTSSYTVGMLAAIGQIEDSWVLVRHPVQLSPSLKDEN